jgi:mono/diheme cytochrome c family protein
MQTPSKRPNAAGALVAGIVLLLIVEVIVGYVAVRAGMVPANADAQPSSIEAWIARTSLHATLRRGAPKGDNPVPATAANLIAGMKLYAANCAVCHGTADGKATDVAHGLYQKPPQLASDGVEDDPAGVTYWKVYHGIRLTGMPSFAATLSENQIWQVTAFLQNMDHLPPAVAVQWRALHITEAIAPPALQAKPRDDNGP